MTQKTSKKTQSKGAPKISTKTDEERRQARADKTCDVILSAPEGGVLKALRDMDRPANFKRREAAVRAAYDNAPAGAEAIAGAVWQTIQRFRPKMTCREMRDLLPLNFRLDVRSILAGKIWEIEDRERVSSQIADDARRGLRMLRKRRAA